MKIKNLAPYLTSIVVLILLILLAEGIFRVVSPGCMPSFKKEQIYAYDPIVGFMTKPNMTGLLNSYLETNYFIKTNNLGFRDEKIETERTRKRVVVLGDSMVWGWAVDQPDIFTEILEKELLNNTEIINLGIMGSGTTHQLMYFKEFAKNYDFDIVIVIFFTGNDFIDNTRKRGFRPNYILDESGNLELIPAYLNYSNVDESHYKYPFSIEAHMFLSDTSCFYKSIYKKLRLLPVSRKIIALTPFEENLVYFYFSYNTSNSLYNESILLTEKVFEEFKALVEEKDKRFYVIILPSREQVYDSDWNALLRILGLKENDLDRYYPTKSLLKICKDLDLACIDLLPVLMQKAAQGERAYFYFDPHLNKAGHTSVAEQIAETILK